MDVYTFMKILIVLVGISAAILEIRKMVKLGFHWITMMVVMITLYWAGYYTFSFLRPILGWGFADHRIFVRSGVLLSTVVFLAKAIRINRSI